MNKMHRQGYARVAASAFSLLVLSGLMSLPIRAHADPPPDKGKQGKGKGDEVMPIKVGPPVITKDPPKTPDSPKKKDK